MFSVFVTWKVTRDMVACMEHIRQMRVVQGRDLEQFATLALDKHFHARCVGERDVALLFLQVVGDTKWRRTTFFSDVWYTGNIRRLLPLYDAIARVHKADPEVALECVRFLAEPNSKLVTVASKVTILELYLHDLKFVRDALAAIVNCSDDVFRCLVTRQFLLSHTETMLGFRDPLVTLNVVNLVGRSFCRGHMGPREQALLLYCVRLDDLDHACLVAIGQSIVSVLLERGVPPEDSLLDRYKWNVCVYSRLYDLSHVPSPGVEDCERLFANGDVVGLVGLDILYKALECAVSAGNEALVAKVLRVAIKVQIGVPKFYDGIVGIWMLLVTLLETHPAAVLLLDATVSKFERLNFKFSTSATKVFTACKSCCDFRALRYLVRLLACFVMKAPAPDQDEFISFVVGVLARDPGVDVASSVFECLLRCQSLKRLPVDANILLKYPCPEIMDFLCRVVVVTAEREISERFSTFCQWFVSDPVKFLIPAVKLLNSEYIMPQYTWRLLLSKVSPSLLRLVVNTACDACGISDEPSALMSFFTKVLSGEEFRVSETRGEVYLDVDDGGEEDDLVFGCPPWEEWVGKPKARWIRTVCREAVNLVNRLMSKVQQMPMEKQMNVWKFVCVVTKHTARFRGHDISDEALWMPYFEAWIGSGFCKVMENCFAPMFLEVSSFVRVKLRIETTAKLLAVHVCSARNVTSLDDLSPKVLVTLTRTLAEEVQQYEDGREEAVRRLEYRLPQSDVTKFVCEFERLVTQVKMRFLFFLFFHIKSSRDHFFRLRVQALDFHRRKLWMALVVGKRTKNLS